MFFAQTIRFALEIQRLARIARKPKEEVERLTRSRLAELVRQAMRAPHFRDKFRGVNPDRFELAQLPVTTKRELMDDFDRSVTDPHVRRDDVERFMENRSHLGKLFRGKYAVSHTSGSQGQPLILVQPRRCLEILFGVSSSRGSAVAKPKFREALRLFLHPLRMAVVTMQRGFYPSAAAFEFMPSIAGAFTRLTWLSAMQDDLIDRLVRLQPEMLIAYPSVLEWLALQPRVQLGALRQIGATGENLSDAARRRIENRFGTPVFDHFGLGECLFLTSGCPVDGGAHVNADWAILEVVDRHYRPVPDGQPGEKILVTNLANTVQPIIRYEVDDVVTIADRPCGCRSRLPWIERIEGRAADVFWIGSRKEQMIGGIVFKHAVQYLYQTREWQAVQVERNRVEVRLELLPGQTLEQHEAERILLAKLRDLGMPSQLAVSVRIVPHLKPDAATGKFRRMISLVDQPPSRAA